MHAATLTVDLAALRANYQLLQRRHAKRSIAAVVKANAYGLGVEAVSRALHDEGCRRFFVATLAEAIELRAILPDAKIAAFNGLLAGEEKDYRTHQVMPVLNDRGQVERMTDDGWRMTAILHIDTGMTRLGLTESDLSSFPRHPSSAIRHLMSHLACANEPDHPKNAEQLARFTKALAAFPSAEASLCNSSGLFLSSDYHFDLARPGCALYGINPTQDANPMQHVATLSAPLLQIRTLDRDETIGYGATFPARKDSRIAIVQLGYADGWPRALSNQGHAFIGGHKVPVAGRISMDMLALDVSALPESQLTPDSHAEFINAQQTVDDIAAACDTIGYEIFTRIGQRVKRVYS